MRWLLSYSLAVAVLAGPALADKYAVIVGVSDYAPAGRDEGDLPGVANDRENFRQTLVRCYGFPNDRQHMIVLSDHDATKASIVNALRTMAKRVAADDEFVFYFAGHGFFGPDQDGDEEDHWDEFIATHEGDGVRDDDIRVLLAAIHGKKTVVFDSCFSGTATRDITNKTRGRTLVRQTGMSRSAGARSGSGFRDLSRARLDHMLIAGCKADQLSSEYELFESPPESVGLFTFYLCEALRGAGDGNRDGTVTYDEAARYARERVAAIEPETGAFIEDPRVGREDVLEGQTVQLEGDLRTRPFAGSSYRELVADVKLENGRYVADVGAVHGFEVGSTLKAVSGTEIEITQLGMFSSTVELIGADATTFQPDAGPPPTAAAKLRVRVSITRAQQDLLPAAKSFARTLAAEPFVQLIDDDEAAADVVVRLFRSAGAVGFSLAYPGGRVETGGTVAGSDFNQLLPTLREAIATAFAVQTLAGLTNPYPEFSVKLSTNRGSDLPKYRAGESMQLTVSVTEPCYVTLVDIATSGAMTILYPPPGKDVPRVTPGSPLRLPQRGDGVRVLGPTGLDRIKAIATRQPLRLSEMVHTRGGAAERVDRVHGLLAALRQLAAPGGRSLGDLRVPYDAWAETSIGIQIVP